MGSDAVRTKSWNSSLFTWTSRQIAKTFSYFGVSSGGTTFVFLVITSWLLI